jgi:hypothetical protein
MSFSNISWQLTLTFSEVTYHILFSHLYRWGLPLTHMKMTFGNISEHFVLCLMFYDQSRHWEWPSHRADQLTSCSAFLIAGRPNRSILFDDHFAGRQLWVKLLPLLQEIHYMNKDISQKGFLLYEMSISVSAHCHSFSQWERFAWLKICLQTYV